MQTAQINSPRFSYQATAPMAANVRHTLDDFRPVHGSYSGSFSGKTKQPLWIAVGMVAVVAIVAAGVNMYSDSYTATIDTASSPTKRVLAAPTPPVATPSPVAAPAAKEMTPPDSSQTLPKAEASVVAKPAMTTSKKVVPAPVARTNAVVPAQPEVVPPLPAIVEPVPAPAPIVIEPPVEPPAVTPPAPVPPVEPPKL